MSFKFADDLIFGSIIWDEGILESLWKLSFIVCWSNEQLSGNNITISFVLVRMNLCYFFFLCSVMIWSLFDVAIAADTLSFRCGEEMVTLQCLLKVCSSFYLGVQVKLVILALVEMVTDISNGRDGWWYYQCFLCRRHCVTYVLISEVKG